LAGRQAGMVRTLIMSLAFIGILVIINWLVYQIRKV
jgi:hypothetical protein